MITVLVLLLILASIVSIRFVANPPVEVLLLLAVILVESFTLIRMDYEHKERQRLERSLLDTRVELGRENYLRLIRFGIKDAESEVLFTTRSMTTSQKEPLMEEVIRASVEKKGRITHRGIIAPRHETIAGAYELIKKANVEIRFHDYYNSSSLRFIIIDRKKTILAIARPDQPSELAYWIESHTLASGLSSEFERLWNDGSSKRFEQYLDEVKEGLKGLSAKEMCSRLGIPEEVVKSPSAQVKTDQTDANSKTGPKR